MGLFDFFKSLTNSKTEITSTDNDVTHLTNITKSGLSIHPDLVDLIWIGDGKYQNYSNQSHPTMTYPYRGFVVKVAAFGAEEPSLLYLKYPIEQVQPSEQIERPPYYPFYGELTPKQKYLYWKFLNDPYNPHNDIGYVFIFYYGLERHLLYGDFEKAFNVILKLRDVYNNRSFQHYSAGALILSTLIHKRADYTQKFINSLDKDYEFQMPGELYFLCKLSLGIPITAFDIMKFHKFFNFTNTRYIKNNSDMFLKNLRQNICYQNNGRESLDASLYCTESNFSHLPTISLPIFANVSIREKEVTIPNLSCDSHFMGCIFLLLDKAHQDTKQELANLRIGKSANSTTEEQSTESNTPYAGSYFDDKKFMSLQQIYYDNSQKIESQWSILYNLKTYTGSNADRYMELCRLNIQQYTKMNDRGKHYTDYESPLGVPAYKRLAMLYEKQGNYEASFEVCIEAIKSGILYDGNKSGFKGRAARMIKKGNIQPDEEIITLLME